MIIVEMFRQDGLQQGKLEGIAECEVRGEAKGEARGITKALREMALKLLKKGMSIDEIMELTELSSKEIESFC